MRDLLVALILLANSLLLAGCATNPPAIYGNGDPGVIVNGQQYWVGNPTQAEQYEWEAFHLNPSFDENEEAALKQLRWSIGADFTSTGAALLLCKAAKEGNPLGWWLLPANYLLYKRVEHNLHESSRYTTWVRPVYVVAGTRYGVAGHNTILLLKCVL